MHRQAWLSHFTPEEAEAQKWKMTCPKSLQSPVEAPDKTATISRVYFVSRELFSNVLHALAH